MPLTKLDMGTWNTVMHVTENLETYHLRMKHMQHQLKLQSAFFNFRDEKKTFSEPICVGLLSQERQQIKNMQMSMHLCPEINRSMLGN